MPDNPTDQSKDASDRRKVLKALGASLSFAQFANASPTDATFGNSSTYSNHLIAPGDPQFLPLLDRFFPGLTGQRRFAKHKPFLALIYNASNDRAAAYRITWQSTGGKYSSESFGRSIFQSPGKRFKHGDYPSQYSTLLPGGLLLVSPIFSITPEEYGARFALSTGKKRNLLARKRIRDRVASHKGAAGFLNRANVAGVSVSLSGALMEAQGPQGQHGAYLQRIIRSRKNGAHDEAFQLKNAAAISGYLDVAALRVAAQKSLLIAKSVRTKKTSKQYRKARAHFAQQIVYLLNVGDTKTISRVLGSVSALSKTT